MLPPHWEIIPSIASLGEYQAQAAFAVSRSSLKQHLSFSLKSCSLNLPLRMWIGERSTWDETSREKRAEGTSPEHPHILSKRLVAILVFSR